MPLDILITVAVSSFIQSIFGVGVLLFGTPLLMLQGYDFFQAVIVLLPISLLINLSQIVKDHKSVDIAFYKKIIVYTIPFIVIFLAVLNEIKINIGLLISVLLLFVAAKDFSDRVNNFVNLVVRHERSYFILMGIVHGLTNLGGPLLTVAVHSKGYEKRTTRATVAASYATFATFQIVTLFFSNFDMDIKLSTIALSMSVGLTMFIVTEKIVYANIGAENYRRLFAAFIFLSGALLFVKSV
tara:strand:- start:540 stop:1262 length:723 start_codon:yes stop_codon:yes gene_type:complete